MKRKTDDEERGLLTRVELSFPRLAAAFDRLRVMLVTDVHFKRRARAREREAREVVEREDPDILVLGGDLANHGRHWDAAIAWLAAIRSKALKVAVPGNWEYQRRSTIEMFMRRMPEAGFIPLCNAHHLLMRDGEDLCLAGVDDCRHGHPDVRMAFAGARDSAFRLLLAHSPDILTGISPDMFDLLLCGHTHGGQIRLPVIGPLLVNARLGRRYNMGLYEPAPGRYLYVSRGLGENMPIRLACPPEIVLVTLRAGGPDT